MGQLDSNSEASGIFAADRVIIQTKISGIEHPLEQGENQDEQLPRNKELTSAEPVQNSKSSHLIATKVIQSHGTPRQLKTIVCNKLKKRTLL